MQVAEPRRAGARWQLPRRVELPIGGLGEPAPAGECVVEQARRRGADRDGHRRRPTRCRAQLQDSREERDAGDQALLSGEG